MTELPESEYVMCVYLIHFSEKIGDSTNPKGMAQHYTGSTNDLTVRLKEHAAGTGAKLMAAVVAQGISWELVATWEGGYDLEKAIKLQKNGPRHCPRCKQQRLLEKMGL